MGLDNYLILQLNEDVVVPRSLRNWKNGEYSYELGYWRNCYRIRNDILAYCNIEYEDARVVHIVPRENIDKIIEVLKEYARDWRYWEYTRCISWQVGRRAMKSQIKRLRAARKIKSSYKLIFIDSF